MIAETKNCQSCKQNFVTEPEDFDFYAKIQVPPPTFCLQCRRQRRYAWRNERVLYRRNCDLCGKSMVTIYSPNKPLKVYCPPCWWGDGWDAKEYAQKFDFSRPFFEQYRELQLKVPRIALLTKNSVNSEYVNHGSGNKNCYLTFATLDSENVLYSTNAFYARDCMDCYWIDENPELLYECISTYSSYKCQYGILLNGCAECLYCYDCRGCSNCFMSSNLRNKQFYIRNRPYSKEQYFEELKKYHLSSRAVRKQLLAEYKIVCKSALHRFAVIEQSVNVTGNFIFKSKNSQFCFDGNGLEDVKYCDVVIHAKSSMDSYHFGNNTEWAYEAHGVLACSNASFIHLCYDNAFIDYCDTCHNSQNLFGCIGLKKASYCILNTQYSPEEYAALRERMVAHMKQTGEYGEFFPVKFSPFGYNETQAQIYIPLNADGAHAKGFAWEENMPGALGKETVVAIPDDITDVPDSITQEIFVCNTCHRNFNVVPVELDFYRRGQLPIPDQCPNCRYITRLERRPPRKTWKRPCQCTGAGSENGIYKNTIEHSHKTAHCPNEFETSYAPERPEIVYCEQCYQAEGA